MAKNVEIRGLDEALRKLRDMPDEMNREAATALYQEAERVMADSKENYVPVSTGTLRSTGHVEAPKIEGDQISVKLGYGGPAAPYALAVHENPRAGKSQGFGPSGSGLTRGPGTAGGRRRHFAKVGTWKYLEIPLLGAVDKMRRALEAIAAKAFKKG